MPKLTTTFIERQKAHQSPGRSVKVPTHRFNAVKTKWMELYTPIVDQCKLEIRMNLKTRYIELRPSTVTEDMELLQKAEDFLRAFILGFEIPDALAMLRLDTIFIDTFEVKDVKTLNGDALSRAIGRVSGTSGKTKFAIENATTTRVVVADTKIHIMGTQQNIRVARRAFSELIMGSPANKIYSSVRGRMDRMAE